MKLRTETPVVEYPRQVFYYIHMDSFTAKVKKFIEKEQLFKSGDKLVLGVSGGADSVALLLLLNELKEEYNLTLSVVCVNHGLRPEAVEEADYVKSLCVSRNINYTLVNADVATEAARTGKGTEEAGREIRYRAFDKQASEMGEGTCIAVAHNKNDLSETMLFHLFRGTGPRGLCSIAPKRGNIIRPLLCVERCEIEDWLNEKQVKFYTDGSNLTDDYSRNRIRHHIVDYAIKEINKASVSHMGDTAESLRDLVEWADSEINDRFDRFSQVSEGRVCVKKAAWAGDNRYLNRAIVKRAIDELAPGNRDITLKHLDGVLAILDSTGHKDADLPYSIKVISENDRVVFTRGNSEKKHESLKLCGDAGEIRMGGFFIKWHVEKRVPDFFIPQNEYTKCFDYDKIVQCPMLRTIGEGDYITINSKLQKKKLSDYYIDEKIPFSDRGETIILADGNNVWWVIGHRIGEYPKITDETKKILFIEAIKEA